MDNFDLRKYLAENKLIKEQADHVAPMVAKAYKEYLEAKKDGGGEKEYRYYSKKLNNTYSTRADRDAIEAILKKKYGSALEEQDVKTKMTDFGPIDIPNTKKYIKKSPGEMSMKELIARVEELEKGKFSNENARELKDLRAELSYRQHFKNESLNEGFEKSAIQNALKNNGYNLKQKDFKVSSKKRGNITHYYLNGEEIGNSEYNYDEFISKATKRIKEDPKKYGLKESVNEDTQSELDKWEGRLWDLENMNKSSNNSDPIKQKKAIEAVKKKIASLKKKIGVNEASKEEMDKFEKFQKDLQKTMSTQGWKDLEDRAKEEKKEREARKSKPIDEIKGFEEFKETGFKLGDKVEFMGSAHPTHIKPIKLTGTIEYFEPADEIGVRVDGYGKFIPFFEIQSNIELVD